MFGGLAFMVAGSMAVGIIGDETAKQKAARR